MVNKSLFIQIESPTDEAKIYKSAHLTGVDGVQKFGSIVETELIVRTIEFGDLVQL
jgi:hypothetical protein